MIESTPARLDHAAREVRIPLDEARSGRLVFDAGTPELALSSDPAPNLLLSAQFSRVRPNVRASGGEVVVTYPAVIPVLGWIRYAVRAPRGRVALNPSIPWELEFRRGVTRLEGDLRDLDVRRIVIQSGVSHAALRLGRSSGTVRIGISGGVSNLELRRPRGMPVRLAIDGSVGSMTLDGETHGALAGRIRKETPAWSTATSRLDVTVNGGISHVVVADDGP